MNVAERLFVHTFEMNCFKDKDYERKEGINKKLVILSEGTIKEIEEGKLYGSFTVYGSDLYQSI